MDATGDVTLTAAALASRLCLAAQRAGWSGPDPYDALGWPGWPRQLTRRKRGRQLILQLHARAPVDIRRLYRRRYPVISKTLALFGPAALRLRGCGDDPLHERIARDAVERLAADASAGTPGWGYPFPVQTRWSFYDANAPNAIATAFGGLALVEASRELADPALAARARAAAEWALDALWSAEGGWFVYHPASGTLIHNANLLVARLAWRALGAEANVPERVGRAVERTLAAQRPDGTFPYGDGPGLDWADSFHTGYVLESLADLAGIDPAVEPALRRGVECYRERFFGPAGEARLWPDRPYPEDGHSAGTALTTLSSLAGRGLVELAGVEPIARRTVTRTVRGDHAVHRRGRLATTRVTYPRWCDGHVALGLATYAAARSGARAGAEPRPAPPLV